MRKTFDLPQLWLLAFAVIGWLQARHFSAGLHLGGVFADFLGGLLVGGGVLLMVLALYEMRRQRTTPMPHATASQLVTSGIFSRTRNPIYLGDVMILTGLLLRWDAVLSLPLIPLLMWILERRYIIAEENRLRRQFRVDYARYCQKTRRWV
ncbi:methyltransferase family protein [Pseudooceanicola sp. 502str34]